MRLKSLTINGRAVAWLEIDGREVKLGEEISCDALCFTAEEPGATIKLSKVGNAPAVNLLASFDGQQWGLYTVGDTITLAEAGDKIYFKADGSNDKMADSNFDYNKFIITGRVAASGNVNSLLIEDEDAARTLSLASKDYYCFYGLFENCSSLTQAPELPATTLTDYCYNGMFFGCTSLTKAPELPATTLTDYCYESMFVGCSALTQAPDLRAPTLATCCYQQMFVGCTSLTKAPELPATILADYCYESMFLDCTNLNNVKVAFSQWSNTYGSYVNTTDWLPENTGTFECPQALIDSTLDRTTNTVPLTWTMVAV